MTMKEAISSGLRPAPGRLRFQDWRAAWSPLLLLVAALLLLIQLFNLMLTGRQPGDSGVLPVSIRAESRADYRTDSQGFILPGISGSILLEIIRDGSGPEDFTDRVEVLEAELSADIPTTTLQPEPTYTPAPGLHPPTNSVASATAPPLTLVTPAVSTPTAGTGNLTLPVPATLTAPPILPTLLPATTPVPVVSSSATPFLTLPPVLPTNIVLPTLGTLFP